MNDKLNMVLSTVERKEQEIKESVERVVWAVEGMAKRTTEHHEKWTPSGVLDSLASNLEHILREVRDLQARELVVRELREAHKFLSKE